MDFFDCKCCGNLVHYTNSINFVCLMCYDKLNREFYPTREHVACRFCRNLTHHSNLNRCGMCRTCQASFRARSHY